MISRGYKALPGEIRTQLSLTIKPLLLATCCGFDKDKAVMQTLWSSRRQDVTVRELGMDMFLGPTGVSPASPPSASDLPVLDRIAKVSAWDLRRPARYRERVCGDKNRQEGQRPSHLCLGPGNKKEPQPHWPQKCSQMLQPAES